MREGIAIAGTILVDKIHEIDAYPPVGQLTKIRRVSRAVGGIVPNVGIDLARMAPELSVYAAGCVGRDADGDYLLDVLAQNGVNTEHMTRSMLPTSFTDVMSIVGGQRTFFTYMGACSEFGFSQLALDALPVKMLHLGYFLLLDKVDGGDGLRILKAASERGIKTSFDMVSDASGDCEAVRACLPYTDNLIINELEAAMLCGAARETPLCRLAHGIMDMGVRERVIIHTADVGVCLGKAGYFELPSFALPSGFIKGSTGAGDAFCAGALLGIYRDMAEGDILRLARAAATACLTSPDSIGGMRHEKELTALCENLKPKS